MVKQRLQVSKLFGKPSISSRAPSSSKAAKLAGREYGLPTFFILALFLLGLILVQVGAVDVAGIGALLLLMAPGLAMARLVCEQTVPRLVLGAVFGVALAVILATSMALAAVPFDRGAIEALLGGLMVLLLGLALRWARPAEPSSRSTWLVVAGVLALGLIVRLPGIRLSELMGDEAKVLLWATRVLQGHPDVILQYRKGPAEIVLTALQYGLLGRISTFAARLPFAVAGILGPVVLALFAAERCNWRVGLLAGTIATLDGFLNGFGHMVQYQSLVACCGIAAVGLADAFVQGKRLRTAAGLAVALGGLVLCHWDMAWYLAMVVWLLVRALLDDRTAWPGLVKGGLIAAAGAVLAGGPFYWRYVTSPLAGAVSSYLTDRIAGSEFIWRDNLGVITQYALVYDPVYYLAPVGMAVAAGFLYAVKRAIPSERRQHWLLGALSLAALVVILAIDSSHLPRAIACWVLTVCGLCLAVPHGRSAGRLAALWMLLPLIGYLLVIKKPLLSVYNIIPGAALTAALALDRVYELLPSHAARAALTVALGAAFSLNAAYALVVFGDVDREYIRTYPAAKLPLFWSPYKEQLPANTGVGFAHRAGWEQIGVLYDTGLLEGSYWSNEEALITSWYTRGQIRTTCHPRYVLVADHVKDEAEHGPSLSAYTLVGRVTGSAASGIEIWDREPAGTGAPLPRELGAGDFSALTAPVSMSVADIAPSLTDADVLLSAPIGQDVALRGFTLAKPVVMPGKRAEARVYYEMRQEGKPRTHVSLRLASGENTYDQEDMPLDCGQHSTKDWVPGNLLMTRYELALSPNIPPGWYRVELSAYPQEWGAEGLQPVLGNLCDELSGQCAERLVVGKLCVGEVAHAVPRYPTEAVFADGIVLMGYDVTQTSEAGKTLFKVRLYWREERGRHEDWVVFVHLLDQDGAILAQHDGRPENGLNPTSTWVAGEQILDEHALSLADDAVGAVRTLRVGLYDQTTGRRLDVVHNGLTSDHLDLDIIAR